jgi:sec-independent protein translocase protein TatC
MSRFRRAESGMTLAEHLQELRYRFFVMTISVTVFAILAFLFYSDLLKVLQHPYCAAVPGHCKFLATNPLDGLTLRVKIAFFGGFLLSTPVILWQTWRFVTPGLKTREKRYIVPFVSASLLFFTAGVVVAYFSFGHAIHFLKSIGGSTLITEYNPNQYLSLFLLMMFIFGLTFLFPVVLVALELANVVTPTQLLHAWRYAVIAITIAAAVFTPSGDPLSMCALAVPLILFYFLAIGTGKLLKR